MATPKLASLDHAFEPYPSQLEHLAGVCCECGDYHDERRSEQRADPFEVRLFNLQVAEQLKPPTWTVPMPEPTITDEALQARCEALATALRNLIRAHESVVEHCIDPRQHMFAEQQERMWRAKQAVDNATAVLVESEGVK